METEKNPPPSAPKYATLNDYVKSRGLTPAKAKTLRKSNNIVMQGKLVNVPLSDRNLNSAAAYMTQADYARHKGYDRSYITELKRNGQLVMHDGKVDVAASDRLLDAIAHPNYNEHRDRLAQQRADKAAAPGANTASAEIIGLTLQKARALKESELAKEVKRRNEEAEKLLLKAEDVKMAIAEAATIIRNRLESLPDTHAAQLAAENDENKVRSILFDFSEAVINDFYRQIKKLEGKE